MLSNISGQTPINTQVPVNEKNKAVEKMMTDFYSMQDAERISNDRLDRGGRNKAFRNSNNYNARRNDAHHMKPISRSVAPKATVERRIRRQRLRATAFELEIRHTCHKWKVECLFIDDYMMS